MQPSGDECERQCQKNEQSEPVVGLTNRILILTFHVLSTNTHIHVFYSWLVWPTILESVYKLFMMNQAPGVLLEYTVCWSSEIKPVSLVKAESPHMKDLIFSIFQAAMRENKTEH